MWILMVEALAALFLLVFIVWWTMYSGRKEDVQDPAIGNEETPKLPGDTPER